MSMICLTVELKAMRSFETSWSILQKTQRHFSEERNLQHIALIIYWEGITVIYRVFIFLLDRLPPVRHCNEFLSNILKVVITAIIQLPQSNLKTHRHAAYEGRLAEGRAGSCRSNRLKNTLYINVNTVHMFPLKFCFWFAIFSWKFGKLNLNFHERIVFRSLWVGFFGFWVVLFAFLCFH
jgi:hypothetical protein